MATKKLKVYGGRDGHSDRMIVAASSWAEVQRITGRPMYELRNYWAISGNPDDITKAMATPGVPVLIPDRFAR